jgi:hypothetical protein
MYSGGISLAHPLQIAPMYMALALSAGRLQPRPRQTRQSLFSQLHLIGAPRVAVLEAKATIFRELIVTDLGGDVVAGDDQFSGL